MRTKFFVKRPCFAPNCENFVQGSSSSVCEFHRGWTNCVYPNCENLRRGKNVLCSFHVQRKYGNKNVHEPRINNFNTGKCSVQDCESLAKTKGYCSKHYQRNSRHGSPNTRLRAANGEGGIHSGYKTVYVNGKAKREHRLVMEKHLGRPLLKEEHVHHIDGNKLNNNIDNLIVLTNSEHQVFHRKLSFERMLELDLDKLKNLRDTCNSLIEKLEQNNVKFITQVAR